MLNTKEEILNALLSDDFTEIKGHTILSLLESHKYIEQDWGIYIVMKPFRIGNFHAELHQTIYSKELFDATIWD